MEILLNMELVKMKRQIIIVFIYLYICSFTVQATQVFYADNWVSHIFYISGTRVLINEYGNASADKVILLPGGSGITHGSTTEIKATLKGQNELGAAYAARGKQLVFVHLPYFAEGRNTIKMASQEVLNIIDVALATGFLKKNYTLIGGAAGTFMISSMFDFNQKGEITNQRLIDNVGRVVMLSGPHNNAQENSDFQSAFILDLMDQYDLTTLTSLDTSLTVHDRWTMYLDKLINGGGVRIVIGGSDHLLCKYDSPCDVSMHKVTDDWIQELTSEYDGTGLYSIYDLPDIVKIIDGANHKLPFNSFIDFIMN
ncbi:hypothetical protein [Methyloprofundus sedimenti]|nr:hypothetical protein [Methyloprofundus sedimenti]